MKKSGKRRVTKKRPRFTKSRLGKTHHSHRAHRSRRIRSRHNKDSFADTRYFRMKMTDIMPVRMAAAQGQAPSITTLVFARFWWGGTNAGQTWYGVDDTARFGQVKNNYQEYATTGMSLQWIPNSTVPLTGNNAPALTSVALYEDLTTPAIANMTSDEMVALSSYRQKYPRATWKHWSNNKPLAKDMNVDWKNTQDQSPVNDPGAAVAIRFTGQQFTAAAEVGYIKYTYYVTFRGQRYEAPPDNQPQVNQTPRSMRSDYIPMSGLKV